jgi:hypothetical protein
MYFELTEKQLKRFWERIHKTDYCWNWTGNLRGGDNKLKGYGHVSLNDRDYAAHRISYMIYYGKIKKDMFILHKCNNSRCCNPDHLYAGTRLDNASDRRKDLNYIFKKGWNSPFTKLTKNDVESVNKMLKISVPISEIAMIMEVHRETIRKIKIGIYGGSK